ncbi:STAS-like domain-containing protein [Desulfovirgula thermocuniculi]|uniref:STAS-like domain-containing protein n=1 Tax=Desulfovirgula thermocuniculi TaxID=348842 RepID=UPI000427AEDF|nr:STAS-like domain-containing protein [Desulfovirgula thermocuniculi]
MIKLGNIGACLTGRALGRRVRDLVLEELKSSARVALDFAGVEVVSHCFCDEAFGKLLQGMGSEEFRRRIKFFNCSPEVKSAIKFALGARLAEEDESCTELNTMDLKEVFLHVLHSSGQNKLLVGVEWRDMGYPVIAKKPG